MISAEKTAAVAPEILDFGNTRDFHNIASFG
jgi:hypothetical protein